MTFRDAELNGAVPAASMPSKPIGDMLSRGLDIAICFTALAILFPLLLVIAGLLKLSSKGPVLFAHHRVGAGGKLFPCYKFRSMIVNSDAVLAEHLASDPALRQEWERDQKLRNDPRVTPVGKFIRRTSLDELPQLFNVLRGDMSIVGPRPVTLNEMRKYGRYANAYHSVRPGITGLWQISGRNDTSYRRRVAMDVTYARKRNIGLDTMIILKTVPAVVRGSGCY